MAKVTETNKHVATAAQRRRLVKRFVRESSALEGIQIEPLRDPKTGRFMKRSS